MSGPISPTHLTETINTYCGDTHSREHVSGPFEIVLVFVCKNDPCTDHDAAIKRAANSAHNFPEAPFLLGYTLVYFGIGTVHREGQVHTKLPEGFQHRHIKKCAVRKNLDEPVTKSSCFRDETYEVWV